jgi:hypothetical protein
MLSHMLSLHVHVLIIPLAVQAHIGNIHTLEHLQDKNLGSHLAHSRHSFIRDSDIPRDLHSSHDQEVLESMISITRASWENVHQQ